MGYVRPSILQPQLRAADGSVIPYGHRWPDSPDDASYSVTLHPERFAPLHAVARALIENFGGATPEIGVPLRIDPPNQDAAPIEFTLTPFPGVRLRAGSNFAAAFPFCGCDACDDSVPTLIDELEWTALSIAAGGLTELERDGNLQVQLESDTGSRGGSTVLAEMTSPLIGTDGQPLAPRHWAPWQPSSD